MNFELLTSKKQANTKGYWWTSLLEDTFYRKTEILEMHLLPNWLGRNIKHQMRSLHFLGKGLTSDDKYELTLAHNHSGDENRIEAKRFQGIIQSNQKIIAFITLDDTIDPLDKICADKFGILLTEQVIQCIQPKQWLNGDVISYYSSYLPSAAVNILTRKLYFHDSLHDDGENHLNLLK
uniref:Uncharacterized protein n=1 Tax=Ditylenchus dipsaci TaxID=166011 RepID=A0A915CRN9_9BILA